MLNFTIGPVQSNDEVRAIGAEQVPYFRTEEFSQLMLENDQLITKFAQAGPESRTVFLTGSGTAAMETAVTTFFSEQDSVLVVNGGSFGQRFVDLCQIHSVPYTEIKLEYGQPLTANQLSFYDGQGFTGFLINVHETSTGVYYDMSLVRDFCRRNSLFLVVDAIGSFLADPFSMEGTDVMIASSQKALACPPGISFLVLSPLALERVENSRTCCMYLDLKSALKNGQRGQTPFTPAVSILRQIHARLRQIERDGGVEAEVKRISELAADFRDRIGGLPFQIASEHMSNAMTPLHPSRGSAYEVFQVLKDQYEIWVCPNGGDLKDQIFRVGHLGALDKDDNTQLIEALYDMQKRGLL